MFGAFGSMRYSAALNIFKNKRLSNDRKSLSVGKTGFEPAAPWSQTRCATGLRHFPYSQKNQRRGRDSNPRYKFKLVQRFSKPALSATQAPLQPSFKSLRDAKIIIQGL